MALLEGLDFVPITSAEHATSVIRAMRSKNGRRMSSSTASGGSSSTGEPQCNEKSQQRPAGTYATDRQGDLCTLDQFNDVVRQELQAIKARKEEEEQRKRWEEMAASDHALLLRLRNHGEHPSKGVTHDREHDNDENFSSTLAAPPACGKEVGAFGAHPQSPLVHDPCAFHQISNYGQEAQDDSRQLQEAKVEGGRNRDGETSLCSLKIPLIPPPDTVVADDDKSAAPVILPECSRRRWTDVGTTILSAPRREDRARTVRRKSPANGAQADSGVGCVTECHDTVKGGSGGGSDRISDTTWSSSEESEEFTIGGSGGGGGGGGSRKNAAFGEVDDWAGTVPYGSDDDCNFDTSTAATVVSSERVIHNSSAKVSTTVISKSRISVQGARERATAEKRTPPRRRENTAFNRRAVAPGSATKVCQISGRNTANGNHSGSSSVTNNNDNFHTVNNITLGGVRDTNRAQLAQRRVTNFNKKRSSPPAPELLPSVPSNVGRFNHSPPPLATLSTSQRLYKKKIGKDVGPATRRILRTSRKVHASLDCPGWRRLDGGDRTKRGKEKQQENRSSRRCCKIEESERIAGGGDDAWVVQEFQARVEAASREEHDRRSIGGTNVGGDDDVANNAVQLH